MKRNILFFQQSISPDDGGVPRVSDVVSKELINRGYGCYFVFTGKDNERYSSESKLTVDASNVKESEEKVLEFIEKKGINGFICQSAFDSVLTSMYGPIKSKYPKTPFIFVLHAAPNYWRAFHRPINHLFQYKFLTHALKNIAKEIVFPIYNPYVRKMKLLYSISDKFVLLSPSFIRPFSKICHTSLNDEKLIVIPNPLTFDTFATAAEVRQKSKVVLIMSRLDEDQKRISSALKIWQRTITDGSSDWRLYIVGSGPDEHFYKRYVKINQLINVEFLGQRNDVLKFYRDASVFMMTSAWEGLPMSLLEAQQNGVVPIVLDNFASVFDTITNGVNGYIISDNNLDEFAATLRDLMKDNDQRYEMAKAAVESSKQFELSGIVDEWEKALALL